VWRWSTCTPLHPLDAHDPILGWTVTGHHHCEVAGTFEAQALLFSDLRLTPERLLTFCLCRWQMEPTFQHRRTHLGVETQRQGSDKSIRPSPCLSPCVGVLDFSPVG
jgi:hypothetical protein